MDSGIEHMCRVTVHCMASTCTKDGHKAEHGKCFEFVMLSTVVEL